MATYSPSQSTLVDIEPPPDISTPYGLPVPQRLQNVGQPPGAVTFCSTPAMQPRLQGSYVRFAAVPPDGSLLEGNLAVQDQSLVQGADPDSMQLCTSSETSVASSGMQHDVPAVQPNLHLSPGKEVYNLTTQVQGNLNYLLQCQTQQEKTLGEINNELKQVKSIYSGQLTALTLKIESNHQHILTILTAIKQQREEKEIEVDQLMKAMGVLISESLQNTDTTLSNILRFMIEQLQKELQQEIKTARQIQQKEQEQVCAEVSRGTLKMDKLVNKITEFQEEMRNDFQAQQKALADMQKDITSSRPSSDHPAPVLHLPATVTTAQLPTTPVIHSPTTAGDHLPFATVQLPTSGI